MIEKSRFNKADVVFVTDGEDSLSDSFINYWNNLKKQKDFRVLSLLLGTEKDRTVRRFSDRVVKASNFQDNAFHRVFEI